MAWLSKNHEHYHFVVVFIDANMDIGFEGSWLSRITCHYQMLSMILKHNLTQLLQFVF